jgi:hypothetical protein
MYAKNWGLERGGRKQSPTPEKDGFEPLNNLSKKEEEIREEKKRERRKEGSYSS